MEESSENNVPAVAEIELQNDDGTMEPKNEDDDGTYISCSNT